MKLMTLGGLRLEGNPLRRPKPLLLLAYLAVEGAKGRRFLSELFFNDSVDPPDALSTTLRRLVKAGAASEAGGVVSAVVSCDAVELLEYIDAGAYERAVPLYTGPFLAGLDLKLGPELEEWVYGTRELVAGRVRRALIRRAEAYQAAGHTQEAEHAAEAAFLLEGAPELAPGDMRRLLRLLADRDSSVTERLRAQAQGDPAWAPAGAAAEAASGTASLPMPLTTLVGRDEELVAVAHHLQRQECRLLTLHGPAGVGKSRLALQAAFDQQASGAFANGVVWVAAHTLTDVQQVPAAIAAQFGITLKEGAEQWEQLAQQLGSLSLLVVLDSLEHLSDGVTAELRTLLRGCPGLKLLITSRHRLSMMDEWVLPVAGLRVPADELIYDDALLSDAVQLFLRRAQAANLQFTLQPEELPQLRRICRAVGGLPLGIELAAVWTRMLPLEYLADNLEQNLRSLGERPFDSGGRHPDLWAALEHSWNLLDSEEQAVFARLAVFRGGFRQGAVGAVALGDINVLMSLVDKSLVHVNPDGRYHLHALLEQFAAEKLGALPDEAEATTVRHAEHYAQLLSETSSGAAAHDLHATFKLLQEEEANLFAGLVRAAERRHVSVLLHMAEPLLWYFPMSGRFLAGDAFFSGILDYLAPESAELMETMAALQLSRAWLHRYAGSLGQARRLSAEGERLAREAGTQLQLVRALDLRGQVATYDGEFEEARRLLTEGAAVAEASGDPLLHVRALTNLALVEALAGRTREAGAFLEEAARPFAAGELPTGLDTVAFLLARGVTAVCRSDTAAATTELSEALRLARELDYLGPVPVLCGLLAAVVLEGQAGDEYALDHARSLVRQGLELVRDSQEGMATSLLHGAEAALELRLGDLERAEQMARRAYGVARDADNKVIMLWSLPQLVTALRAKGEGRQALHLSRALQDHPAAPAWVVRAAAGQEQQLVAEYGEPEGAPGASLDQLVGVWLPT